MKSINLKNLLMFSEIVVSIILIYEDKLITVYESLFTLSFCLCIRSIFFDASFKLVMSFIENCSSGGDFGCSVYLRFAFGDPSQALMNDGGLCSETYPDIDPDF